MAESICASFRETARRLLDLGLGYLTLDRSAFTLSTGERQRMQLARAVRDRKIGEIVARIERSGLVIERMEMTTLERATVEEHYAHLPTSPSLAVSATL